jgi:hypothetical protein
MTPIPSGAQVRQITPAPFTGAVVERRFNESHSAMEYLVENTDADGHVHSKWFVEGEIEATGDAA